MRGLIRNSVLLLLVLCLIGSLGITSEESHEFNRDQITQELSNAPLSEGQVKLLALAFGTASKIPLEPHIKDRARTQEAIVLACMELKQYETAFRYADEIPNWRRGYCFAVLATDCIRERYPHIVTGMLLGAAEEEAMKAEDWRRDRVRVEIARANVLLGDLERAEQFSSNVELSEQGKVSSTWVSVDDQNTFEQKMNLLSLQLKNAHFDLVRHTLEAYVELYRLNYTVESRKALIEETIEDSWRPMPLFIRLELLNQMADCALDNNDKDTALNLLDKSHPMINDFEWKLEHKLPILSSLSRRLYLAGKKRDAKAAMDDLLLEYQGNRERIVNIWRAGALRPVAEAFWMMDDHDSATFVYELALREGVENPNSRPRAEDLAATATSMALHGYQPDSAMMTRMHEIHEALRHPW